MLIFTLPVAVGGFAGITFKKQQLTDPFIGINTTISPRTITKFQGEMPLPASLCWSGIHNDA